jgi:RHS repeat-associated protein
VLAGWRRAAAIGVLTLAVTPARATDTGTATSESTAAKASAAGAPAQPGTTPSGSFTTMVAIQVPKFRGLEPDLTLSYNSAAPEGITGLGWRLGAASAISRASATEGVPRYDAGDTYFLDGERLYPCDTPARAPGCDAAGAYYTERRATVQIVDEGAAGWVVRYPDGARHEYRFAWRTPDGHAFQWLRTLVSDASASYYGDAVAYTYAPATVASVPLLTAITYGPYRIDVSYEDRPDPSLVAIGQGPPVPVTQRLKLIDETLWGARIRTYRLRYATSQTSGRSLLTSVQDFGADAQVASGEVNRGAAPESGHETKVTYPNAIAGASAQQATLATASNGTTFDGVIGTASLTLPPGVITRQTFCTQGCDSIYGVRLRHLSLDFDGDGLTDHAIVYFNDTTTWITPFRARADGSYQPLATTSQATPGSDVTPTVADVNGDDIADIVLIVNVPDTDTTPPHAHPVIASYLYNAVWDGVRLTSTFALPGWQQHYAPGLTSSTAFKDSVLILDVNGDGVADVVSAGPESDADATTLQVRSALGRGDGTFLEIATSHLAISAGRGVVLPGDFDGDGALDLGWVGYAGSRYSDPVWYTRDLQVCTLISAGSTIRGDAAPYRSSCRTLPLSAFNNNPYGWVTADLDGDGVTDLIQTYTTTVEGTPHRMARVFRVDADAYRMFPQAPVEVPITGSGYLVGDVDGDGADDLSAAGAWHPTEDRCTGHDAFGECTYTHYPAHQDASTTLLARTVAGNSRIDLFNDPGSNLSNRDYAEIDSVALADTEGDGELDLVSWQAQDHTYPSGASIPVIRFVCTADGACPAIPVTFDLTRVRRRNSGTTRWLDGDVDGDGDRDRVRVARPRDNLPPSVEVLERQADGSFVRRSYDVALPAVRPGRRWRLADADADGRVDLTSVAVVGTTASFATLHATATGWQLVESTLPAAVQQKRERAWYVGDFDGDGRTDWACLDVVDGFFLNSVYVTVYRSLGDGRYAPTTTVHTDTTGATTGAIADWVVLDLDGDRVDDLARVTTGAEAGGRLVSTLRLGGTPGLSTTWVPGGSALAPSAWQPAEVNGDGIGDLVALGFQPHYAGGKAANVEALMSSGDGSMTWSAALSYSGPILNAIRRPSWIFADTNVDGITDLTHLAYQGGAWLATVFRGRPTRYFFDGPSRFVPSFTYDHTDVHDLPTGVPNLAVIQIEDVWGDQVPELELFQHRPDGAGSAMMATRLVRGSAEGADLASAVEIPAGAVWNVVYRPMRQQDQLNDPGMGCRLPPGAGSAQVAVVQWVDARVGDGAGYQQARYRCPVWSARRGARGWRTTTMWDQNVANRPDVVVTTDYDVTEACGAREQQRVRRVASGEAMTSATEFGPIGALPYRCTSTASTTTARDAAGVTRTTRVERIESALGDVEWLYDHGDVAVTGDERSSHFERSTRSGFLRTLDTETLHAGLGAGTVLAQTTREYDWAGRVTTERRWDDVDRTWATTTYTRDWRGNPVSVTDPNGATTETSFDLWTGVYPEVVTDPLGHRRTMGWNLGLGALLWSLDENRQATQYYLDPYGHAYVTQTTDGGYHHAYPDRLTTAGGGQVDQLIEYQPIDASHWKWIITKFDGLGRRTRVEESTATGQHAMELHYSDAEPQPALVSTWFDSAAAPSAAAFTAMAYDGFGRVVSTTLPDGAVSRVAYATGVNTATDPLGNQTRSHVDAGGRLVQLDEPHDGGSATTRYAYDLRDDLRSVIDPQGHVITQAWDSLGRLRTITDPDRGTEHYGYDAGGNLTETTDGAGVTTTTDYDLLARPITRTNSRNARTIDWTYDEPGHGASVGRLTSIHDSTSGCAVESRLEYDAMGGVTALQRCYDGVIATARTRYNLGRQVAETTYPDGEVVQRQYGSDGRVSAVPGLVSALHYDVTGALDWMQYANGVEQRVITDPARGLISDIAVTGRAGPVFHESYGYDTAGRLMTAARTGAPTRSYTYDAQGRLRSATGAVPEAFTYDSLSNMTSHARTGTYQYAPAGPAHGVARIVDAAGVATDFAYDPAGRLLSETRLGAVTRRFSWDEHGQLASVTLDPAGTARTTLFAYDASQQRIKQVDPSGNTTYYLFDLAERTSAGWVKLYTAGGRTIARRDEAGTLTFLHADRLGSTAAVTGAAGTVVAGGSYDYTAFGERIAGAPGAAGQLTYTGEHQDATTADRDGQGLIYLSARYYDPATARFLSPDSLVPRTGTLGQNRYAYTYQRPTGFTDPSGHLPKWEQCWALDCVTRGDSFNTRKSTSEMSGQELGAVRARYGVREVEGGYTMLDDKIGANSNRVINATIDALEFSSTLRAEVARRLENRESYAILEAGVRESPAVRSGGGASVRIPTRDALGFATGAVNNIAVCFECAWASHFVNGFSYSDAQLLGHELAHNGPQDVQGNYGVLPVRVGNEILDGQDIFDSRTAHDGTPLTRAAIIPLLRDAALYPSFEFSETGRSVRLNRVDGAAVFRQR